MGEMTKSYEILVKKFWGGSNLGHVGLDDRIILKLNLWKMVVKETASPGSMYYPVVDFCGNGKEPAGVCIRIYIYC
jgi:hypothetical protein